jgi:hypothetical protein
MVITSNYCVIKEGDSYTRRVIEYVISDVYSPRYQPKYTFGHTFFDDWNEEQWYGFDNTMILAVQFYLKNGVIEQINGRKYYQLQNQTTDQFMGFAESFETRKKYDKKELLEDFMKRNPTHIKVESNTFTRWLKLHADYKIWRTLETHSGGINYIQFYEYSESVEETKEEATVETTVEATVKVKEQAAVA